MEVFTTRAWMNRIKGWVLPSPTSSTHELVDEPKRKRVVPTHAWMNQSSR